MRQEKEKEKEEKRLNAQRKKSTRSRRNAAVSSLPDPSLLPTCSTPSTSTAPFITPTPSSTQSCSGEASECAFCFAPYSSDGMEWLEFACGQWVHEDCLEDVHMDEEGRERFCPFCLNNFL